METKFYSFDNLPSGNQVVNTSLVDLFSRVLVLRGICKTAIRQWLSEVEYTTPSGERERKIAFDLGNGSYALSDNAMTWDCPSGVVHINRGQNTLCIVRSLSDFLAMESQDVVSLPKCDYLIYIKVRARAREASKITSKICKLYDEVHSFLPSELFEIFGKSMTPKKGGKVIDHTKTNFKGSVQYISTFWSAWAKSRGKLPQWQSCLRCTQFGKCTQERLAWSFVCDKYKTIGERGEARYITHQPQEQPKHNENVFIDTRPEEVFKSRKFLFSDDFIKNVEATRAEVVEIINAYNPEQKIKIKTSDLFKAERFYDEFNEPFTFLNLNF